MIVCEQSLFYSKIRGEEAKRTEARGKTDGSIVARLCSFVSLFPAKSSNNNNKKKTKTRLLARSLLKYYEHLQNIHPVILTVFIRGHDKLLTNVSVSFGCKTQYGNTVVGEFLQSSHLIR